MSTSCYKCSSNITKERFPGIKCSGPCENVFHVKCADISEELLRGIKNRSANWLCEFCRDTFSQSVIETEVCDSVVDVSFADIMKQLKKMELKLSALEELKLTVSTLVSENSTLMSRVKILEEQLDGQTIKHHLLEAELDKPNQIRNTSRITITGLPIKHGDIHGLIVNTISKVVNSIQADDIIDIEQISRSSKTSQHNKTNNKVMLENFFIVTLKSVTLQNEILSQMRKKKTLHTKNLDVFLPRDHPEQRIFIMQHLSKFQAMIYREAKNIKTKYNYKYLWCKMGQIYLRKSADSGVHRIHSMNDIFRLTNDDHPIEERRSS